MFYVFKVEDLDYGMRAGLIDAINEEEAIEKLTSYIEGEYLDDKDIRAKYNYLKEKDFAIVKPFGKYVESIAQWTIERCTTIKLLEDYESNDGIIVLMEV